MGWGSLFAEVIYNDRRTDSSAISIYILFSAYHIKRAGLAQSVERQALNLIVEGSSPSFGAFFFLGHDIREIYLFFFFCRALELFASRIREIRLILDYFWPSSDHFRPIFIFWKKKFSAVSCSRSHYDAYSDTFSLQILRYSHSDSSYFFGFCVTVHLQCCIICINLRYDRIINFEEV